jgi:alkylhydroperoxidase family enzyme
MLAAPQDALVAGLQTSPPSAPDLTPAERALLDYTDALTLTPALVTPAHIEALRRFRVHRPRHP